MKILLLIFTAIILANCADTRDCVCLRDFPVENNPLVIPKDLDGKPLTVPTPE